MNDTFFGCIDVHEVWEQSPMWNKMQVYIDNAIGIVPMLFQMLEELEATVLQHIAIVLLLSYTVVYYI
jgi:hypothetical protein